MFFGNSRITLHRTNNCERFGLTDKNFVVTISNGYAKDDVLLAYLTECPSSFQWLTSLEGIYYCAEEAFCETGLTGIQIGEANPCADVWSESLSGNAVVIENSYVYVDPQTIPGPFCTNTGYTNPILNCGCPTDFTTDDSDSIFLGDCFKSYPIETLGLQLTSEIEPCKFLFASTPREDLSDIVAYGNVAVGADFPTVVNVFYKTFENGSEICNVVSFSNQNGICLPTTNCWPPQQGVPVVNPCTGQITDSCSLCQELQNIPEEEREECARGFIFNGDICSFENTRIVNSNCGCYNDETCFGLSSGETATNCFFSPGITSTEPCVNGSWNGQTCTDGYNDVCGSEECVDRICKEMDWFIANYGASSDSFAGYSNFGYDYNYEDDWFVSCGQTSVNTFFDGTPGTTSFGNTVERRRWDRVIGMLHHLVNNDINDGSGTTTVPFESESCRIFYPTQVCCAAEVKGYKDVSCPICSLTGFDSSFSYGSDVCCCSENTVPIIMGIAGYTGFDEAINPGTSFGLPPTSS